MAHVDAPAFRIWPPVALGLPLGRLPGDFTYRRDSFSFYLPLTSSMLVSIVLTLIFTFWGRR